MIGRTQQPLEVPLDQPWSMDFRFWQGRAKTVPSVLASADMILRLRATPRPTAIVLTGANISMQGNTAGPRVTDLAVAGFTAGTWDFALRVTDTAGGARQVRGTIDFVDGV